MRLPAAGVAGVAIAAAAAAAAGLAFGAGHAPARPVVPLRVSVVGGGLAPEVATAVAAGDGRVVTVAHVLRDGGRVRVGARPARVVRVSRRLDLAVLAVPGLRGPRLRLAVAGARGDLRVLRSGRALSVAAVVRRRATARIRGAGGRPVADARPVLELAAPVEPGDSGAPVADARGRVLGIVFAQASGGSGTAWAVAAPAVRSILAGTGG